MKKQLITFLLISICSFSYGQNLVPNPGFEDTTGCATNVWPNLACKDWFPGQFSPDYYSNSYTCFAGVYPLDFQAPHSGLSYVGFYFWQPFGCIREYISVKLTQSLVSGHQYCLEYYISRHEAYGYSTNRVGAYFSQDTAYINNYPCNLNYLPQIKTPITQPTFDDTLNWVLVTGSFIATGGEQFMTIGNFSSDDSTISSNIGGPYNGAYYFVDDVTLNDCSVGIAELNSTVKLSLFPNPTTGELNFISNENKPMELIIYACAGREIFRKNIMDSEKVDVSSLSDGIYFYELISETKNINRGRFVKKN
ncbi:hypothetical protein BH09BAC5_BH09BAC5_13480 [soil metagenome]